MAPPKHYLAGTGRSELCRGIGGPNKVPFYRGWISFISLARRSKATLTIHADVPGREVQIAVLLDGVARRYGVGATVPADKAQCVAVCNALSADFDVSAIHRQQFLEIVKKVGGGAASHSFDSGMDVVDSPRGSFRLSATEAPTRRATGVPAEPPACLSPHAAEAKEMGRKASERRISTGTPPPPQPVFAAE